MWSFIFIKFSVKKNYNNHIFFFQITGIILLTIGLVIHGVYSNYHHFLDDRFFSVPSLLIAIGSIIFIIAFFGCCGAIKENYCMIVTVSFCFLNCLINRSLCFYFFFLQFSALMVLVFILELSAGISGYVLRSDAYEVLQDKMLKSMVNYNSTESEVYLVWDQIQDKVNEISVID